MFRIIKESENVDERQHCFLIQTVGGESRSDRPFPELLDNYCYGFMILNRMLIIQNTCLYSSKMAMLNVSVI